MRLRTALQFVHVNSSLPWVMTKLKSSPPCSVVLLCLFIAAVVLESGVLCDVSVLFSSLPACAELFWFLYVAPIGGLVVFIGRIYLLWYSRWHGVYFLSSVSRRAPQFSPAASL